MTKGGGIGEGSIDRGIGEG